MLQGERTTYELQVHGTQDRTYTVEFTESTTLKDLKLELYDRDGTPLSSQRILFRGKEVQTDSQTLFSYGIRAQAVLYMVMRQRGGSSKVKVDTTIDKAHVDMISRDADEKTPRVITPCRHYITPESLAQWVTTSILEGSSSSMTLNPVDVECPQCRREPQQTFKQQWIQTAMDTDWVLTACGSHLTAAQQKKVSSKLSINAMRRLNVRKCVHCKSHVEATLDAVKVVCAACGKPFCNKCDGVWTHAASTPGYCGNAKCLTRPGAESCAAVVLREEVAASKMVAHVKIACPDSRACPKCRSCIFHMEACKHMKCPICSTNFCFICLGVADISGKFPASCGLTSTDCTVAARQTFAAK